LVETVIDPDNPVVKLCLAGTRAELEGKPGDAQTLYQQAWDTAQDDYEACIAAHYLARFQQTPTARLHWNHEALRRADAVADPRIEPFYPSLYLSMGYACAQVDDQSSAQQYYALAAALGAPHQPDAAPLGRGVGELGADCPLEV
jgi:hypothetical protein